MEIQGSVRLFSWTQLCFILLLSVNVEVKSADIYTAPNNTVVLNIPECNVVQHDSIVWTTRDKESVRLARWKDSPLYEKECENICEIHENGTLTLKKPKQETTTYNVTVRTKEGDEKCSRSVTVIVQDPLDRPLLKLSCTSKVPSVTCSTSAPSISSLTLSWSGHSYSTSEKIIQRSVNELTVEVTCSARNRVSESNSTMVVNCAGGWNIYLIVSVAGGAVFLIIFIVLVICVVKYKPWRHHSRSEEQVAINRIQSNTERQLPQPSGPAYVINGDNIEDISIQKPHEPGGRKGKQGRDRRPPPQAPVEAAKVYAMVPPHKTVPALPGNHPNEQAPRPQPRTKSKPPRQKRRQDCQ